MPVPRHSRATGDKTLAAHRAALPPIQTAKRGHPPFGYPRDTTNAGRMIRSVIPACVLRIVCLSCTEQHQGFLFPRSNGNLNDTAILNSQFSLLNCSVRGRHGAHCAPLRTHTVGALTERPPAAETFRICHCEPVTDVTGVAIRFPLRSDYRLRCVLWQAGMPAGGLTF